MFFLYIVSLILSFIGIRLKYSHTQNILAFFVIFLICLMGASMRDGYDTNNFISSFQTVLDYKSDAFETISFAYSPLYFYLVLFSIKLGITNFFVFKFIILIICYILISKGIKYRNSNICIILFLYLLGPFFDDVMQLRNTISLAICIYATKFLYRSDRKSTILYILLIFLATLNHFSFAFAFLFLLSKFDKHFAVKMCFLAGLFLYFFTLIFRNFFLVEYISGFLVDAKLSEITSTTTRFGSLGILLFYIVNVFLVYHCNKRINYFCQFKKVNLNGINILELTRMSTIIYDAIRIMAICLFMSVTALSFSRMIRDVILLFLLEFSIYNTVVFANNIYKEKTSCIIVLVVAMLMMLFWMYFGNFVQGPPEDIIYSVFRGDINWFGK